MKLPVIVSGLVLVVAVAVGNVFWLQEAREPSAYAELKVDNLTCVACVGRVTSAAKTLAGVGAVEVDLAAGRARVAFDSERVTAEQIAVSITSGGYPAALLSVQDARQRELALQEEARLAQHYVGKIGERLIPREEFAQQLSRLAAGYSGEFLPPGLELWAWQELLQRELLLLDSANHAVTVADEAVTAEIEKMRSAMPNFDTLVAARYGSVERFAVKLKDDLIIREHLDAHLFNGESDARKRQELVELRLQDLATRTPIFLYDADLKARMGSGGGCGGACC